MKSATCERPETTTRSTRRPALPRNVLPADDDQCPVPPESSHLHGRSLVVVQRSRVVCVVEGHRHAAVLSVARLLCRLLLGEVCVYACDPVEAQGLSAELPVPVVPDSWSELYRTRPWADGP